MSEPAPRHALQQRVSAAILEGAAQRFALDGAQASMSDVATAAGVARATVYRYFPNREALLDALVQASASEVDDRLTSARIDAVDPEEGIVRAVRALVGVRTSFLVMAHERQRSEQAGFERALARPLRELFERGQAGGDLRADLSSARLTESLIGLTAGVLTSTPSLGVEDTTATITGLFLDGARARGPRRR